MLKLGDTYSSKFCLSQYDIKQFAEVSGDKNPLHLDEEYAAQTPFKSPIVHGMFSASIVSKVLGMEFPGEGTLYLSQNLEFKRPIYPEKEYEVRCEIIEILEGKHIATISTKIFDQNNNKIVLDGSAKVRHMEKLP